MVGVRLPHLRVPLPEVTEPCTLLLAVFCSPYLHRHCDDTAVLSSLVSHPLQPQLSPMHRQGLMVQSCKLVYVGQGGMILRAVENAVLVINLQRNLSPPTDGVEPSSNSKLWARLWAYRSLVALPMNSSLQCCRISLHAILSGPSPASAAPGALWVVSHNLQVTE